jgi:transposase-like protein
MSEQTRDMEIQNMEIIDPIPCKFEGVTPARAHSQEVRDEVIRRVLLGDKLYNISQDMGIQIKTMEPWIRELEDEIRVIIRAGNISLIGGISQAAEEFIRRLTKNKNDNHSQLNTEDNDNHSQQEISAKDAKDLSIALGVLIDKRKDLAGPGSGSGKMSMRIAWKDGSGAVELTTGGQE